MKLALLTAIPAAFVGVIVISAMTPEPKRVIPVDTIDFRTPPVDTTGRDSAAAPRAIDTAAALKAKPSSPMRRRLILRDSATIFIGSTSPNAAVFVNDRTADFIAEPRDLRVAAGTVRLSIRSPDCRNWDTVLTIAKDARVTLGVRNARCP